MADELPFNPASTAALRASDKKVFAHYFPPYPISLDNQPPATDYYTRNYLHPNGESGKHAAYGGLLRDRPLPRDPISTGYELADMKTEVEQAIAAGIDGFAIDILSFTSANWTRAKRLVQAGLNVNPAFLMLIQLDMTSLTSKTAAECAAKTMEFVEDNAWRLSDGRLVVSAFKAENKSVGFWSDYIQIMEADYDETVAFFPLLSNWSANIDNFKSISYGVGTWGSRSPKSNANIVDDASVAHSKGLKWMQPVSVQDARPSGSSYYESQNLQNLRVTWEAAINGGSDHVMLATWNDYSESTSFAPSRNHKWTFLDVSQYYTHIFKFGEAPTFVRDGLYLTHRLHHYETMPTWPQTEFQQLRSESSPARNTIEIMSMLTASAGMTVHAGGTLHNISLPAGLQITTIALSVGDIAVELSRDDIAFAAEYAVTATPLNQTLEYYGVASLRSGTYTPPPIEPPGPPTTGLILHFKSSDIDGAGTAVELDGTYTQIYDHATGTLYDLATWEDQVGHTLTEFTGDEFGNAVGSIVGGNRQPIFNMNLGPHVAYNFRGMMQLEGLTVVVKLTNFTQLYPEVRFHASSGASYGDGSDTYNAKIFTYGGAMLRAAENITSEIGWRDESISDTVLAVATDGTVMQFGYCNTGGTIFVMSDDTLITQEIVDPDHGYSTWDQVWQYVAIGGFEEVWVYDTCPMESPPVEPPSLPPPPKVLYDNLYLDLVYKDHPLAGWSPARGQPVMFEENIMAVRNYYGQRM